MTHLVVAIRALHHLMKVWLHFYLFDRYFIEIPRIFFLVTSLHTTWHFATIARDYSSLERMHYLPDCFAQREMNETTDETLLLIDSARPDYLTINLVFELEKSFVRPELLFRCASIKLLSDQINRRTSHNIVQYLIRQSQKRAIFANRFSVNLFSLTWPTQQLICVKLLTHPSDRRVRRRSWRASCAMSLTPYA